MAIPQRTATEGTFFITTVTYNRRRLFQVPANAELFLETLQYYRTQGAYKLHAFVVMPDHTHLLSPQTTGPSRRQSAGNRGAIGGHDTYYPSRRKDKRSLSPS
jgi:REP element-mobilizing transposase RayT